MNRLRQSRWRQWRALLALFICSLPVTAQPVVAFQAEEDSAKAKNAKSEATPESKEPQPVTAIVGATVITMGSEGILKNATILIQGDQIVDVGVGLKIPEGAINIAADNMTVVPGLIDCRSSLWLASDSITASASDGSLNALDAVDPFSNSWKEVASQGITTVNVGPKGSLGGLSVILRVAPATSTPQLLIQDGASMQASLGLSGSTGNSRDRYLQYEALKKTFTSAKAYQESWEKYEAAIKKAEQDKAAKKPAEAKKEAAATGKEAEKSDSEKESPQPKEKKGTDTATSEKSATDKEKPSAEKKAETPAKPKRDPVKDVLVRVLKKELPLRIEAHRADDIANAIQLASDFDLTVTFEGVSNAGREWSTLKSQHPALVVGPFCDFESTPAYASDKADRYHGLKDYDGLMAISTFARDSRASRFLRFHAAAAVASGLTPEQALKAITIDAARVLGIDSHSGSIEKGKKADLVIASGSPVDPAAAVMLTMSHGEVVFQNDDAKPTTEIEFAEVPSLDELPDQFALVSDRILYPDGKMAPGAVLVRKGRIAAVRKAKSKTGDLPVIDVGNSVVTPGLIVGHLSDGAARTTDAVASQVRAIDSLSPASTQLKDLSKHGFTTVMYAPASQSVVAGQIGCVRFAAAQQILIADNGPVLPGSKFVLSSGSRSTDRFPASLPGQLTLVGQFLQGSPPATNLYLPDAAQKLLVAEEASLLESLKNKTTTAVIEASSSPEIEAATKLAEQFGLKALILAPDDPASSIKRLLELKAGLIIRTAQVSDHDWYAKDIAAASNAGLKIAVSGDDAVRIRQTLAMLVGAGMSPEAALRSITSDAAAGYNLKNIGRLANGAFADIVIWNDSPLNAAARPIHVIVDGRLAKDLK